MLSGSSGIPAASSSMLVVALNCSREVLGVWWLVKSVLACGAQLPPVSYRSGKFTGSFALLNSSSEVLLLTFEMRSDSSKALVDKTVMLEERYGECVVITESLCVAHRS